MLDFMSKAVKWTKGKPKVVVVGAGLSGLIAAIRLLEAGVDVTVLEHEPRVGGRIYSESFGGSHVNLGAQYFFKSDNQYLNYYIDKMMRFAPERGLFGALWDDTFVTSTTDDLFLKLPIERVALEQFEQATTEMRRSHKELFKGKKFVFDREPANDLWYDLDKISAEDYLSKYHPDVANLFNTLLIPEGGVGVAKTSALLLVGWYGAAPKGNYLIENGNQTLTEAIAEDIVKMGGEVKLSTEVTEIVNTDSGASVHSTDGTTFNADYVVVTTPATVAAKLVKGMSPEKTEALEAVRYGASMQVGLHLTNVDDKEKISSCFFHNEKINAYMDQTKELKRGEAIISLNIAGEEAHALSDDEIIERVSAPLMRIYPDFDAKTWIVDFSIKKWTDGIVLYPSGFLTKHQDMLRAPSGNIYFGGDYTHNPALDGAAWSGIRSAEQVIESAIKMRG